MSKPFKSSVVGAVLCLFLLALSLTGCGTAADLSVSNVTASVNKGKAVAMADLQKVISDYKIAKGLGQIASLVNPAAGAVVAGVTAIADPVVAKAQVTLDAGVADIAVIENLVALIQSQAQTIRLAAAPSIMVVPTVPAAS